MQLIHGARIPDLERPTVVTVGSFDGVHRGHQALLQAAREEADRIGGAVVVVTFEPHPRIALGRGEGLMLLTELEEKSQWLAHYGVDYLVVLPFDRAFAAQSGAEFAYSILVEQLGAKVLIAGYNHRFGCDRMSASELRIEGLEVRRVEKCVVEGVDVSSSAIRERILAGQVAEAEQLLGHTLNRFKP